MRVRTILRWGARVIAGTVGLVLVAAAAGYGFSEVRMARHFAVPEHRIVLRGDSAEIANGKRLATVRGCVDCHGSNFAGTLMIDSPIIGRLASANLTMGGRGKELDLRDWERAVRHGVRRDGSGLRVMPSQEFTTISDEDLAAIVAYIRSVPAVEQTHPTIRVGPIIRALYLADQVALLPAERIDHTKPHEARVVAEVTPKFGEYVASGCTGCHGPTFSGGKIPGSPPEWKPAANLTPAGIGHYKEEDFVRALRTGIRPGGSQIDSAMPWKLTKEMTDVEIKAIYSYLKTVKPKEYGNR